VHIQPSLTAMLVLLVALSIDVTRAASPGRVARKIFQRRPEADALHFSRCWSTIVVIAGIGLVWAGETWNLPWLNYADALAGLTVAAVILWVGAQLGRRTLDALLDAAPQGLQQEIAKTVARMDGVLDVDRVRVRRAGNRHFVDATVSVARTASLEQVHALSDAIEKRIGEIVPADVMVHAEPRAPQGEHLFEAIRGGTKFGPSPFHDLTPCTSRAADRTAPEVDRLSSREAHRQATGLEEKIRELLRIGARLRCAWFRVHHHIGGNDLANAFFDGVAQGMHLLEAAVLATLTVASTKWRFRRAAPARDRHPARHPCAPQSWLFPAATLRRRVPARHPACVCRAARPPTK